MCGGDSPTMSTEFLKQFCNNTAYMPFVPKGETITTLPKSTCHYKKRGTYQSVYIKQEKKFPVSNILEYPEWQGDSFLYADEILSKGLLFNIKHDTAYLEKEIAPTETQKKAFSRIPASQFEKLEQKGFIFTMANCVAFTPQTEQAIVSYSLPDLSFEKDSSIAYYNKPVLLEAVPNQDSCSLTTFDFEHNADTLYMYTHASRVIPINEQHVLIGCKKGFPTSCTAEECHQKKAHDIFDPAFYEHSPICAIFDKKKGKLIKRFGHLDEVFRTSKTGYYFTMPVADIYKDRIVYSDGYSGKLWITKQGNEETEQEIRIFNVTIPTTLLKSVEALQYTDDYFNPFFPIFHQYIEMIKVDSQGIHCLIRHGNNTMENENDSHGYCLVNFDGKILNRFQLQCEEGDKVLSINLGKDIQGNVFVYYMCQNAGEYYLKLVKESIH